MRRSGPPFAFAETDARDTRFRFAAEGALIAGDTPLRPAFRAPSREGLSETKVTSLTGT
ncbi:hypothetical protein [Mycobacterium asiaticum]|uniref:hypothetical protein n=1 Tax=Mycobacterium asiaticum TaxID=1790 RepID=UPI000A816931|nr:hypothetical protein [Mycobacterium asiaticum]